MGLTYPDMSEARNGWRQDDKRHTRLTRQRGMLPNDFRRRIGLAGSLLRTAGVLCQVSRLVTVHWITGRNRLLEPFPLRCAELTPASESSTNAIAIAPPPGEVFSVSDTFDSPSVCRTEARKDERTSSGKSDLMVPHLPPSYGAAMSSRERWPGSWGAQQNAEVPK